MTTKTYNIGTLRPLLEDLHSKFARRQLQLNLGDGKFHTASVPSFIKMALKNRDVEWHFDSDKFRLSMVRISPDTQLRANIELNNQFRQVYALILVGEPNTTTTWVDPISLKQYNFKFSAEGASILYIGESKVGTGAKGDKRGAKERIRQHTVWTRKYQQLGEASSKAYPLYRFLAEQDPQTVGWHIIDSTGSMSENEYIEAARAVGFDLLNVIRGSLVSNFKE